MCDPLSLIVCVCVHACMCVCVHVHVCVCMFYDFELLRSCVQFSFWLCFNVRDRTTAVITNGDE